MDHLVYKLFRFLRFVSQQGKELAKKEISRLMQKLGKQYNEVVKFHDECVEDSEVRKLLAIFDPVKFGGLVVDKRKRENRWWDSTGNSVNLNHNSINRNGLGEVPIPEPAFRMYSKGMSALVPGAKSRRHTKVALERWIREEEEKTKEEKMRLLQVEEERQQRTAARVAVRERRHWLLKRKEWTARLHERQGREKREENRIELEEKFEKLRDRIKVKLLESQPIADAEFHSLAISAFGCSKIGMWDGVLMERAVTEAFRERGERSKELVAFEAWKSKVIGELVNAGVVSSDAEMILSRNPKVRGREAASKFAKSAEAKFQSSTLVESTETDLASATSSDSDPPRPAAEAIRLMNVESRASLVGQRSQRSIDQLQVLLAAARLGYQVGKLKWKLGE
jgi:hypothetical protein